MCSMNIACLMTISAEIYMSLGTKTVLARNYGRESKVFAAFNYRALFYCLGLTKASKLYPSVSLFMCSP